MLYWTFTVVSGERKKGDTISCVELTESFLSVWALQKTVTCSDPNIITMAHMKAFCWRILQTVEKVVHLTYILLQGRLSSIGSEKFINGQGV